MLYSEKIATWARQIAAMVGEAIEHHGASPVAAAAVWQQVVQIAPVIAHHPSLARRFLKHFPKVGTSVAYWDRKLRDADSNRSERTRRRGVAVTATALQNFRHGEAKKRAQKVARFPGHDAARAACAKKRKAIRLMTAAIELFQRRAGWLVWAVTLTMPGRRRKECSDFYDSRLDRIRKRLERGGKVSERLCYWFMTELTHAKDDLFGCVGAGVEHWHGFLACPQALAADIRRQFEREFGAVGEIMPTPDNPNAFAPALLLPIFDAGGWAEYCCKRIGQEAEGARAQATGKRFRRMCGFRPKELLLVNKNGETKA